MDIEIKRYRLIKRRTKVLTFVHFSWIYHFAFISFSLSFNCQFSHIFGFLLPQVISFKQVIRLCTHKINNFSILASPLKVNCGFLLPKQIGGNCQNSLPLDKKTRGMKGPGVQVFSN